MSCKHRTMQARFGSPLSARRSLPVRNESARLPLSAYSMRHHVSSSRDCLAAGQDAHCR